MIIILIAILWCIPSWVIYGYIMHKEYTDGDVPWAEFLAIYITWPLMLVVLVLIRLLTALGKPAMFVKGFLDEMSRNKSNSTSSPGSDIIRCKDCKHGKLDIVSRVKYCDYLHFDVNEDDFCSRAERRSDERSN